MKIENIGKAKVRTKKQDSKNKIKEERKKNKRKNANKSKINGLFKKRILAIRKKKEKTFATI